MIVLINLSVIINLHTEWKRAIVLHLPQILEKELHVLKSRANS